MVTPPDITHPVVLLHGLGRSPASMLPLDWYLSREGFTTQRLGYPSTEQTVSEAIAHVGDALPAGPHIIIGHSLGGLIGARLLRAGGAVPHVIQLGSPNLGSAMAERMGPVWPVRALCGPALSDLEPHEDAPPEDPRIAAIAGTGGGIIAGNWLESPHDGAVSQRSAWAGAGHRAEAPVIHTLLPASPTVARLICEFLTTGRFPDHAP